MCHNGFQPFELFSPIVKDVYLYVLPIVHPPTPVDNAARYLPPSVAYPSHLYIKYSVKTDSLNLGDSDFTPSLKAWVADSPVLRTARTVASAAEELVEGA
jgi:hypothetical protein